MNTNIISTGIDRTVIKGFELGIIQRRVLLSNNNVDYYEKAEGYPVKEWDEEVEYRHIGFLKIVDDPLFKLLRIGVANNKKGHIYYASLEITINDEEKKNLKPLTMAQYLQRIHDIKLHLKDKYGLYIDFKNAYFEELEVNKTAIMDRNFSSYDFLLTNIGYLIPGRYTIATHRHQEDLKQLEFYNKSIKGKVYDKTRQLQEQFKLTLDKQYMRVEYCFKDNAKVINAFATRSIYKLKDEDINSFLNKQINKELIKPIRDYITTSNKKLLAMAKQIKKDDKRKWVSMFITSAISERVNKHNGTLDLVVDIEQLKAVIKQLAPHNYTRTVKNLEKTFSKYPYLKDNLIKLDEITNKFL